ncbi:VanZ family protein [Aequorivita echinoideorum]|uniref:VanZ family protein n=1 Tax=Aequorivita echinoideorum TaxID=1549647 RepID=A0ABS5S402_9FLAO|nr:VanZ family protein [Aequorivita echinoideorum]MBT0607713.1 VanZ family protein [Aequorivita echinoideorum]
MYSIFITAMFFLPTSGFPKVTFSAADKLVHVGIYFFLAISWQWFISEKHQKPLPRNIIFGLLLAFLFYGIIIEILQHLLTASRDADLLDVLANMVGTVIGVLVFRNLNHFFRL